MNKTSLMVRSWQWNFHSALISIAFRFSSAESRLLGDLTFKRISIHCCRRKFPASEKQEMQKCKKLAHKEDNYVKDIVCDSARLLYQILFVASARGESPRQEGDEGATMRWGSALQVGPSVPLALTRNVSNRKLAIIVLRFNPPGRWVPDRGLSIVLDLKVVCSWWVFKQFCPQTRTHSQREIPHQKIICKRAALTDLTHRDRSGAL